MPYKNLADRIAASKRYYQTNQEKLKEQARERYRATKRPTTRQAPGKATTNPAEYLREWTKANPEKAKSHARRYYLKSYGLTEEQYEDLLARQGGVCALCPAGSSAPGQKLHIDHDHMTGAVRGLLCITHNTALGKLGDSIEGLERAVAYLRGNLPAQELSNP